MKVKLSSLILPTAVLCVLVFVFGVHAQQRSTHATPNAGVWSVNGKDAEGAGWRARLWITRRVTSANLVTVKGFFDWVSSDSKTSGREYVKGTFHRDSGRLNMQGYAVRSRRGEIMKTSYRAIVNRSGRLITRGRWSGKEVVKGNWTARWLRAR